MMAYVIIMLMYFSKSGYLFELYSNNNTISMKTAVSIISTARYRLILYTIVLTLRDVLSS